jgi:hypothetical protein
MASVVRPVVVSLLPDQAPARLEVTDRVLGE